jgi:hypothetical protein
LFLHPLLVLTHDLIFLMSAALAAVAALAVEHAFF